MRRKHNHTPRRYNTRSRRSVRWDLEGVQTFEPSSAQEDAIDDGGNGMAQAVVEDTSNYLKLATLNIIDGRRNRLNAAIRCMSQMNVDIAVLTETKFHNNMFTKSFGGYTVDGTITSNGRTGGIALIHRASKGWGLESTRFFGPNVVRTTLVSGQRRWFIIGVYIPPSEEDGSTLDFLTEAYVSINNPRWPVMVVGDLNMDPRNPAGNHAVGIDRRIETDALITSWGMTSMADHFRQSARQRGRRWTWQREVQGVMHRSVCDHILADQRQFITNCQIRVPRFETDHRAIVCTLRLGSVKHHQRYVRSRSSFPIPSPSDSAGNQGDRLLSELQSAVKSQSSNGRNASWISNDTWRLIDQKASARKLGQSDRVHSLKKLVRKSLQKDRTARAARAAAEAQSFLEEGDMRNAFGALKGWYRDYGPRPPKPSMEDIAVTREEHKALHAPRETLHPPLPSHVQPFAINDEPPSEEEVAFAVRKLKTGKAAGATGIKAEHLKAWYAGAYPSGDGVDPDPSCALRWQKVLELVRLVFAEGVMPQAFNESILVLIPKQEQGQFRGIALLDILYKVVSGIINERLKVIEFHDALHGSVSGRGTGTAIMEAKLLSQLRCRLDDPLYMIFIDLKKAFYSLDRERAMLLLEQYGVGVNLRRIIKTVWDGDTMVPRQAGYFGQPFMAHRGVRVGDNMSPTIFNIVIDAVLRHWQVTVQPIDLEEISLFYIDDGVITGVNPVRLQRSLDVIIAAFQSFGLIMNADKTKYMVVSGSKRRTSFCSTGYNRRLSGEGASYRERMVKTKVLCVKCGTEVMRSSLSRHQLSKKCKTLSASYEPPTPDRDRVAEETITTTPTLEPTSYSISIPLRCQTEVACPVANCPYTISAGQNQKRILLRKHFRNRHIEDTIRIEEEGLLPQCSKCGIFMKDCTSDRHQQSKECSRYTARRQRYFSAKRLDDAVAIGFKVGDIEIERVKQFRYLGRIMTENDEDHHAMARQLARAKEKWGRFSAILRSQGVKPRVMGYFYKAVVQAVLLYGSESWVLSDFYLKQLRSFHARVARYLTGRHIRQLEDGSWYHPRTDDVLEEAGLESVDTYIKRRRDTVRRFVVYRPLYRECRRSNAINRKAVWWNLD